MSSNRKQTKKFAKVNVDQALWLATQEPCVMQLFFFSIASSQFSSRFQPLVYKMSINSFKKAKIILEGVGFFEYKEDIGRLPSGRIGVLGYQVKNLLGCFEESIEVDKQANINQESDDQILIMEDQNLISSDQNLIGENQNLTLDDQNLIAEDQNLTLMRGKSLANQGQKSPLDLIKINLDLNKTNLDPYLENKNNKQDLDLLVGREEHTQIA